MLLRLNCHIANLSASLEISLPYQAVYYYLLDNLVSGPSFVPTVIAALHPSNIALPDVSILLQVLEGVCHSQPPLLLKNFTIQGRDSS